MLALVYLKMTDVAIGSSSLGALAGSLTLLGAGASGFIQPLEVYTEWTGNTTAYGTFAETQNVTLTIVRVGLVVTLSMSPVLGQAWYGIHINLTDPIPLEFLLLESGSIWGRIVVSNNFNPFDGWLQIDSDGYIQVWTSGGDYAPNGYPGRFAYDDVGGTGWNRAGMTWVLPIGS